ncbi:MAG: hypothetical protein FWE76_07240, partial [Symbiobacteriaceae bacterium]|nr:hypothetical protein [Symbiobacteriaceae bacterium]
MITSLLSIATARRKQHLPLLLAVAILLVACNPAPVSPDSNGPSVASWPATSPTSANPETGAAAWQAKLRQCMVIPHDYNDLILAQGKSFKPYFEYTVVDGRPYIRASSYDQSLWSVFDITVTESPSFGESGEFYDSRFHLVRLRKDRPNPNSYSLPEDAECRLEIDLAANMALLNGEPHEAMPASYRDGLYTIMISVTDILEAFGIEWASSTDYTFIGPWSRQLAEETTREQYAMIQAYFALGPLEENPFYLMEESDVRYLASFQDSIIVPISTGEPLSSPEGNWFIRDGFFVEIIIDDSVQKIMCGLLNAETGFLTKFTLSLDYGYSDRFISAYNIYPTDAGTFLTIQLGGPTMGHQELHFLPTGEQETVVIAHGSFAAYFGLYEDNLFFLESNSGPWAPGPGNLVRYSLATGQSSHLSYGSFVFGFAAYHYGSGYTHGPSGSFFLPDARLLTIGSTLSGFLEESSQNRLLLVDLFNPAGSTILTPDTL